MQCGLWPVVPLDLLYQWCAGSMHGDVVVDGNGFGRAIAPVVLCQSVGSDPYFVLFFGSAFLAAFFHSWLLLLRMCTTSIGPHNTHLPHLQMFWVGLCTSLNGLLVVYASPPSRTSAFLQALLYNFMWVWFAMPAPLVN